MLTAILVVVAILVAGTVVFVTRQPDDFRVTRSTTIAAPPTTVYGYVNNLHQFQIWSPWAKLDPASKTTFEGPPAGTGATFTWSGNNQIGEGRMTVIKSTGGAGAIQTRLSEAVCSDEYRRLHLHTRRSADRRDLEHERKEYVDLESHGSCDELRQDGRRAV